MALALASPAEARKQSSGRLAVSSLKAPAVISPGTPAMFSFRLRGHARRARVTLRITAPNAKKPAAKLLLGLRRVGTTQRVRWTAPPGRIADGSYAVSVHATDGRGRGIARSARAPGWRTVEIRQAPPATPRAAPAGALFPVQGPFTFGGSGARFGAGRAGHIHQGQDVLCALGTPVVSPIAGEVVKRAYQASGAGHYLVIRGDDGADYALMHFHAAPAVAPGTRVSAGSPLGQAGQSGSATAPHLHLEMWPNGWQRAGSKPVDPLPLLQRWALTAPGAARQVPAV